MSETWIDEIWPLKPVVKESNAEGILTDAWTQCLGCEVRLTKQSLLDSYGVCPKCGHHHRLNASSWLDLLVDKGSACGIAEQVKSKDFLQFHDRVSYQERLKMARKKTGSSEALLCFTGKIHGVSVVLSVFEFGFIGGSMGYVVGERFVQAVHEAIAKRLPLVCVVASGGARMQEGVIGLFQMAKVSAAIARLKRQGLAYITLLVDPTSGGVAASLAMQADIILAEKGALIGFTGPRVIEQTLKEKLPEGFQRADFLLKKGAVDAVVHRHDMAQYISRILRKLLCNTKDKQVEKVG